jgi:pyrimidine oxygenase
MAGLAAVTSKIKLFGTAATLVMPPAIVARMATTIDSISGGRFGINLITGWQRPEYSQMGLWPGDDYFGDRYEYLGEYTSVLKELLTEGQSDFKGKFFQMDDCRMKPVPQGDVKLICAGSSNSGMAFSAKFADYSFCFGVGVNTPKAFAPTNERLLAATEKSGREVKSVVLTMILAEEKSEDAWAKWEHYKAGADEDAIKWLGLQSSVDTKSGSDTNVRHMSNPVSAVNINMGTLIGSYEEVAAMLDEMSEVPGTGGVMLTFDDFLEGVEKFGKYVQPLMKSRQHVLAELEAAE